MANHEEAERLWDLIIIGGGAAGFFGAIQYASRNPRSPVLILEKSNKVLSKVRVSGGGRCNVTHACNNPFQLARHYPRGEKMLKNVFPRFSAPDMVQWLNNQGVQVHTEEDGRIFPTTNNSQTIIDCFMREAHRLGVRLILDAAVLSLENPGTDVTAIHCTAGVFRARAVLVATGGNPQERFYDWLSARTISVIRPIPSLFTFNDPEKELADLMGLSVREAEVRIEGSKFRQVGPVLITHWGLSGPAVIKLSAWAAEFLFEKNYRFRILINWTGTMTEVQIKAFFQEQRKRYPRQQVATHPYFNIPLRLWERLCQRSGFEGTRVWSEASNKQLNKLLENLIRCPINIAGKTTFKEEFVTCGGVDLADIDWETMQSRKFPSLFFAGEVLNVDGETGGFNFQAAWTTAYVAAEGISTYLGSAGDAGAPGT